MNNSEPIITKQMFLDIDPRLEYEAKNVNGPCMVQIPDWVADEDKADPAAVYYLYFTHHGDPFIRMAWSAEIEGPYTLYHVHRLDSLPCFGAASNSDRLWSSWLPWLAWTDTLV